MSSRAEVGDRVRDDLPGAVDAVVASVREQVPAYAELSTAQRAEVAAIAGWAIERVLDLWVREEGLTPADVRRFEGIGAARALDGRPLPGVLRAYRVGAARVTDLVADVGADLLTVGDALALTTLWMAVLDLLSEAMWTGHSRATDRVTADRGVALGDLLADIVAGRQSVRTALADRCRELGVVLPARPVVVVSTGPAPDGAVLATVQEDVSVALLADVPRSGIGRSCAITAQGTADVPRAHRLAHLVVTEAPDHAFGVRLLDEGDAQVLALLRAHRDADALRLGASVLGAAADDADLTDTLDA